MSQKLLSINDACRITGVNRVTIYRRVEKSLIKPVMKQGKTYYYDADELLEIARADKNYRSTYPLKACRRCGTEDYGNEVRGGLCFECWSHDYCKKHKL